jgi:hypothetical protein
VRSRNTRRGGSWLVMLVSGLGVIGMAQTAHALPLVTLSGSLRGLYGSALGDQGVEGTELNPYGIGIGLRGGVTLPSALYLGASFDYFFGESDDDAVDIDFNLYQVMGNVGYDIGLGPLTLRPSLGLGVANISVDGDVLGISVEETESDFVLSPGAEGIIGLGLLSVSAEVRYNKIFADDDADALIMGVGFGFSL